MDGPASRSKRRPQASTFGRIEPCAIRGAENPQFDPRLGYTNLPPRFRWGRLSGPRRGCHLPYRTRFCHNRLSDRGLWLSKRLRNSVCIPCNPLPGGFRMTRVDGESARHSLFRISRWTGACVYPRVDVHRRVRACGLCASGLTGLAVRSGKRNANRHVVAIESPEARAANR